MRVAAARGAGSAHGEELRRHLFGWQGRPAFQGRFRLDPNRVAQAFGKLEVSFAKQGQLQRGALGRRHRQRGRDADADLHVTASWNRKQLNQHPAWPRSGDQQRIALLPDDAFVRLAHRATAAKRGFAFLTVDPQGGARYDGPWRQLDLGPAFLQAGRCILEEHGPFQVAERRVGVYRAIHARARQHHTAGALADPVAAAVVIEEWDIEIAALAWWRCRQGVEDGAGGLEEDRSGFGNVEGRAQVQQAAQQSG